MLLQNIKIGVSKKTETNYTKKPLWFKILGKYLIIIISLVSCSKLVDISPPITSVTNGNVYNNDATAIAVVTGLYTKMSASNFPGGSVTSLSYFGGLSADEFVLFSGFTDLASVQYYKNMLTNSEDFDFWNVIYPEIFTTNSAIEGLTNSTNLTPVIKSQLLGEAKFMRAFFYLHLTSLYGNVPLALSSDYTASSLLPRASKNEIYQQIISDLIDAQNLLSANYLDKTFLKLTTERVRPTKGAATALLARAYLYSGDNVNAIIQATLLIQNSAQYSLNNLNNVFLKNSTESIWQLQPVKAGQNTPDAWLYILPASGPSTSYPVYLSNYLINSFEPGDNRFLNWVGARTVGTSTYYYPNKYKSATLNQPVTEYEMVLRLGEQFLIRAEAEANTGGTGITSAISDLNIIRNRAGLPNYTGASDRTSVLNAILHERQIELFSEWGHRWIDLKRMNAVDAVMSMVTPQKGGSWNTNWQLYPIPLTELQSDPKLTQNPGY